MKKSLKSFIDGAEIPLLEEFLFSLPVGAPPIVLHNDIILAFAQFAEEKGSGQHVASCWRFLRRVQEIIQLGGQLILVFRQRRAICRLLRLKRGDDGLQELDVRDFLAIKERLIRPDLPYDQRSLEIDLSPFYDYGPSLRDPDTIGNGIAHLNQYMSTSLAHQPEKWTRALYEFLKLHQLQGMQLLIDGDLIPTVEELESRLEDAVDFLERSNCLDDLVCLQRGLAELGFRRGWGDTAGRMLETMRLLQNVLEQPNGAILEEFLSRIPMVSKAALISPHGWFGQHNVLGRPDTGGQVVYVLDQARALERYLAVDLRRAGIDIRPKILIVTRLIPENEGTSSDERLEKVEHADNVWILRVPFRNHDGSVVPHWISRFAIWPYLDQFVIDSEQELIAELGGLPDLITGNYSDGNLVATRLAKRTGVIQCNIAHALEKSKYLFSDLHWQNFEPDYHFSVQFAADLIAMNMANFIVSSTRQEITGTDSSIGQYESYQFFTMPGLMNVASGINLFHPRFNVIPPGVSSDVFFPYTEGERREPAATAAMSRLLFEEEDDDIVGRLAHPERKPIFSIARLDRIKNLTGLVEAYAGSEELRRSCNLILIASTVHPDRSKDGEEAEEIRRMHRLIDEHELHGHIRWLGKFLGKEATGEAFRVVADRGGVFVQPALFEAFGLTILEAMHSGLPVFATKFGGPLEIIEHGRSGFLINPTDASSMVETIAGFFADCREDEGHWLRFSTAGLARARENFTWELHCRKLIRLTKVYGFWKYSISGTAKNRMRNYCDLLYHLFFKARAEELRQ
ncbi:MAG: sucrose synthase [Thermodesulfobacteriota bacterium]